MIAQPSSGPSRAPGWLRRLLAAWHALVTSGAGSGAADLEAVFEENANPMLLQDRAGRVVRVNRAWERLFSLPRAQVLGRLTPDLIPTLRAGSDGSRLRAEFDWPPQAAPGAPRSHVIAAGTVLGDGGAVITFTDLSDRKAIESALLGGREQLDLVLRATHAGVWDFDFDANVAYFSARFKEILLHPPEASLSAEFVFDESIHPADKARMREAQRRHLDEGEEFDQEFRLRRADGSFIWVQGRGVSVRDAGGRPARFVGSITDISLRKNAERELASRERHYRELVETSSSLVWTMDTGGRLTFVNRRGSLAVLGYEPREIIGRHFSAFGDGADPNQDQLTFEQMLHSRGVWTAESRWKNRDGHRVHLSVTAVVTRDARGRAIGILGTAVDITERVERERSLHAANRRAVEAAEAKAKFLATMSHEIRTPLNGVIATTSLMLDTNLSEEQHEYVEIIRTSGESLLALINDILDFSKIEAERLELERTPFAVVRPFDDAIDILGERARGKRIELLYRIEPDVPPVLVGDMARVRQILLNLFANAVKFTERGEIVAEVRLVEASAGSVAIEVSVRDTGIGIAADKIDRLFEPFTQADSSTTRRFGGTGLGLAICRRLCRMMDGDIRLESVEGRGSCFTATLRLALPAGEEAEGRPLPDLAGRTAFVLERNPAARAVMLDWLRDRGMQAEGFDGSSPALAAARTGSAPDVVLVSAADDLEGGDAFLHLARGEGLLDGVPALLLANRPRRHLGRSVEEFDRVMLKPVKPAAVIEAIGTLLAAGVRQREITAPNAAAAAEGRPLRALVAEDHDVNQLLARRMLEKLGCEVVIARNGREALAAVAEGGFDIVFMDMQMPEMDGVEATRRIRALPGCSPDRLAVVAMTANATIEDRVACLQSGMNGFLTKPLDPKSLQATLREWGTLARRSPTIPVTGYGSGAEPAGTAAPAATADPGSSDGPAPAAGPGVVPSSRRVRTVSAQRIAELAELDPAQRRERVTHFLATARQHLDQLRAALAAENRPGMRTSSQALKGLCLAFGAGEAATAARQVEMAARRQELAGLAQAVEAVAIQIGRVEDALEAIGA